MVQNILAELDVNKERANSYKREGLHTQRAKEPGGEHVLQKGALSMLKDSGGQDGKIVQKEFEDQAWGNNVQDSLPFSLCGQDLYDDLWDEMAQAYASNLELPMWVNPHSWFCSPSKASPKEGSQAAWCVFCRTCI